MFQEGIARGWPLVPESTNAFVLQTDHHSRPLGWPEFSAQCVRGCVVMLPSFSVFSEEGLVA